MSTKSTLKEDPKSEIEERSEEEKKFYEECKHDYQVMLKTAKKHGIKNPIMEIPFEVDF